MLDTISRCGSRVEFSAITEKTTSPSCRYFSPSLRGITLHCGGKMEDTRTRFCDAIPASRRASSKLVKRSLCVPLPLVKKIFFGTIAFPNFYVPSVWLTLLIFIQFPHEFIASSRVKTGFSRISSHFHTTQVPTPPTRSSSTAPPRPPE
jgi:hypothetical protein